MNCDMFNVLGYLFLGLSIVCKGKKLHYCLPHNFFACCAPDPTLAFLSIRELRVSFLGLAARPYPAMKLYVRERNVLITLHERVIALTCYVLSATETVVYRTKAAEHGSCPQPYHGDRVSRDKETKTVPSSPNVHFTRLQDVAPYT